MLGQCALVFLEGSVIAGGRERCEQRALCFVFGCRLELELQAKLDGAWTTRTHDRIRGSNVWSNARESERVRVGRIDEAKLAADAIGIGEVGMIEYVKEFTAELNLEAFLDGEILDEREIPILIAGTTEEVAAHGAKGTRHRRSEDS